MYGRIGTGTIRSIKAGEATSELRATARTIGTLIGTNLAIMAAIAMVAGDDEKVKMEPDLRSSDGGKIRFGNTRIDLWAGMLQPAQLMVRLATGQKKDASGHVYAVDRKKLLGDFLQTKESPLASLMMAVATGKRFYGEPIKMPKDLPKETYERLMPLAIQDFGDALMDANVPKVMAVAAGLLSATGVGVQTYPMAPSTQSRITKNEIAQKQYGKVWEDLTWSQQKNLRRKNPEIKKTELEAKKTNWGPPVIQSSIDEQYETGEKIKAGLSEKVRAELDNYAIKTGITRSMGNAKDRFYLNDKRYKTYTELTTEFIDKSLAKTVASPTWESKSDTAKQKILQEKVNAARKRTKIILLKKINKPEK